jgi:hypothetical protein
MSSPTTDDYDEQGQGEPDLDALKERYWEEYTKECAQLGIKPDLSDFELWFEDKYI